MAAVKYDVSDVESGGGGEEPQPGTYQGRIVSITHRTKRNDNTKISDFEVVVDIGKEFVRLWSYVKLPDDPAWNKESHGWKLRELTDALGLPPKGSIDPAKINKEKPPVTVKVTADSHRDTGDYRGRVKNLFPPSGATPEDDDVEPDPGATEGPYERGEIEGWDDADIRGYAEELGVENITGRGWKTKLIDAIMTAQDEAADGGGGDDPEADGGGSALLDGVAEDVVTELKNIQESGEDYLGDWGDDDLKWIIEGLGIGGNLKTSGRGWQAKAKTGLVEYAAEVYADGEPDNDAEPDADADATDDMDDVDPDTNEPVWSDQDLKDEISSRNEQGAKIAVVGRWTRDKAIAALREDNKSAEPF